MKLFNYAAIVAALITFTACGDDDNANPGVTGTFELEFDHYVGTQPMVLGAPSSGGYQFATTSGEKFNLSLFGYYLSKIKLEGPNGELFEDEMSVSAAEAKGYYRVDEDDATSQKIILQDVPKGTYDQVTFTIGVDEDGVTQGASGGILDPAEDAWFWNWNAGYVSMKIEGTAENSPRDENAYSFHVGGWKDIPVGEGESQVFFNNLVTVTLNFDAPILVDEDLEPNAHIVMDLLKVLDGAVIDFSTTNAVHSPVKGKTLAENISEAFSLEHTHQ